MLRSRDKAPTALQNFSTVHFRLSFALWLQEHFRHFTIHVHINGIKECIEDFSRVRILTQAILIKPVIPNNPAAIPPKGNTPAYTGKSHVRGRIQAHSARQHHVSAPVSRKLDLYFSHQKSGVGALPAEIKAAELSSA
jgi:hypothetical protein